MERREMLKAAASTLSFVAPRAAAMRKVLYFTRSAGFEHSVVQRQGAEFSHSERLLAEIGRKAGFDVESTKDGRIFEKVKKDYEGFLTRPTDWKHAVEKFERLTARHADGDLRRNIIISVARMEDLNVTDLTGLLELVPIDERGL